MITSSLDRVNSDWVAAHAKASSDESDPSTPAMIVRVDPASVLVNAFLLSLFAAEAA
ncbi:MAG TPA: hypothetical protein VGL49_02300 [Acidimicrobiales bacterium]|jgi:hypothetical protein